MLLAASSSGSLFAVAYCRTVIGRVSARSCQKMRECVWALAVEGENHPANLSGERKTRVCCTKSPARAISAMCQHTLARFLATTDEKGSDLESAPAWTAVGACARKPRVALGVRGSVCACRGRVVRPVGRGRRRLLPPHGRGCPLFQPSSGTLVVVRSRLPSLPPVRVALPCRCRLLPLQQPNVKSSRPARFPDVFLGG